MARPRFLFLAAAFCPALVGSVCVAAPVHICLKPQACVSADADGFFTLDALSTLSGGDAAARQRMRQACVGRAPFPGEVRHLTPGDVLLKLRQAGFHPERDAVLEGAADVAVTLAEAPPAPNNGGAGVNPSVPAPPLLGAGGAFLVHHGDSVTIVVRDSDLCITAKGQARENGRVGDVIRVHREGVMTDLTATVLDAETVQLEM